VRRESNASLDAGVIAFDKKVQKPKELIVSSSRFVANFIPPDYAIDGVVQRKFIYSMTAPTGGGKTAIALLLAAHKAMGWPLGNTEVPPGRVLYLAGENPDDTRMRWIAMAEHLQFDVDEIDVHFVEGAVTLSQSVEAISREVHRLGGVDLLTVDTSAAYFEGDNDNDNVQMLAHARMLRTLTTLPGGPCVIVPCHPVKNANNENLLPRGGGAFLNEMDGNLVCIKKDLVVDLHTQGKFRGAEFEPISFQLQTVTCEALKDTRGRSIPTVMAKPLSEATRNQLEETARRDEDALLVLMNKAPGGSQASMAEALGWVSKTKVEADGRPSPQKSRVNRTLQKLKEAKLVASKRGQWTLTKDGKNEAQRAE